MGKMLGSSLEPWEIRYNRAYGFSVLASSMHPNYTSYTEDVETVINAHKSHWNRQV